MKRLFIFDLDGMILDTFEDSFNCVNRVLIEFNIDPYPLDYKSLHYPSFRKYLNDNDAGKDTQVYQRYIELYREDQLIHTKAFNGIIPVLKKLEEYGVTLAICSNREEKTVRELAEKYFENVHFKHISGYRKNVPDKPDPYRLLEIINNENVKHEEVVYFGDKDADVKVAINAGVDLVLVTYGQGSIEDYESQYPLRVIDTPGEILEMVNDGTINIK